MLLDRYGIVPAQIQPNAWHALHNIMIKCAEVGCEPQMKALLSILTLKWGPSVRSIVCTSYKKAELVPPLPNTLHKWQPSFLFILPIARVLAF